ncbi:MAG: S8 family serine peptidase [Bacteroidetes bacterium]|nr:S8 family serine peptidase [Bacteroidota bacterium]
MKTMLRAMASIVLVCLSVLAEAQDTVAFTMTITDPAYLPEATGTGPLMLSFAQPDLNGIVAGYQVYSFQQAYPRSRFPYMRQVYFVTANSISLMNDLQSAYPDVFVGGREQKPAVWEYTTNDYGAVFGGDQKDLDLIRAKEAWDIDSGGAEIKIGIVDTRPDTFHAELRGKVDKIYYPGGFVGPSHGTTVTGIVAGKTNNNIGLSSIGFLCHAVVGPSGLFGGDSIAMLMSQDGIKVINISWRHWCEDTLDFTGRAEECEVYNEVYENGTTVVCAAGNAAESACGDSSFVFPASFDHNISVTAVGQNNDPIIPWDTANHEVSVKDYHLTWIPACDSHPGFFTTMTHNSRVDLSAPGLFMGTICDDTVDCNNITHSADYDPGGVGSSLSAPLVAGTVGLMLHAEKCPLTPYQIEYILKATAHNIDGLRANAKYRGQLGAGRLDAAAADSMVKKFNCNNPIASTMYIDGVDCNPLCVPGHASNKVNPKFSVRIKNGTPPYTYRWVAFADNHTGLDDYTSATPSIISFSGDSMVHYLLTVTDASPIARKEANARVSFKLRGGNYDLAMRDSYFDRLDEPNSQAKLDPRNFDIWTSPDLWNRRNDTFSDVHQNPEYFSGGDSNWMYVRIRNVGCNVSPLNSARVKMYWTLTSPGEVWPKNWINHFVNIGGNSVLAGSEITPPGSPGYGGIVIPMLQPGEDTIFRQGWKPQNPVIYGNDTVEICALARIEAGNVSPLFGMAFKEDTVGTISTNVRNNNNIVTRNMILLNLGRTHAKIVMVHPLIANANDAGQYFSLKLFTDNDIHKEYAGNLSEYLYAKLNLDPTLFERWQMGGSHGVFGAVDSVHHTIIYDPATPLRLDSIYLDSNEFFPLEISFALRDSVAIEFPVFTHIYLQQTTGAGDSEQVYGQVGYELNIEADSASGGGQQRTHPAIVSGSRFFDIYPNPVDGMLHVRYTGADDARIQISVTDISGRVLLERCDIPMQSGTVYPLRTGKLASGVYVIRLSDDRGNAFAQKFVKE